jgi:hypothetical protein
MRTSDEIDSLAAKLRAPFSADHIEWLPKQLRKEDRDKGKCERPHAGVCADDHPCGGWHARSIHLRYIGHAGVTDRLNEVDPGWHWEPMAFTEHGTPLFSDGGMWIRLHVLDAQRIGFGDAAGKTGPNAVKEAIGDAIRNAAMRFGVGTYLWSKSDAAQVLAAGGEADDGTAQAPAKQRAPRKTVAQEQVAQGPEPWAETPAPQQVPVTTPQLTIMHIKFGEHGMDRDGALTYCSDITGRPVQSTKELSKTEASRIISALEENRG